MFPQENLVHVVTTLHNSNSLKVLDVINDGVSMMEKYALDYCILTHCWNDCLSILV